MTLSPAGVIPQTLEQRRQWLFEDFPVLEMTLSLPRCGAALPDRRLKRIERYYAQMARSYERYCTHFVFPRAAADFRLCRESGHPFTPWTAALTASTALLDETVWSLYIDSAETAPGEAPFLLRRSDTWSLLDGYPLLLSDFFSKEPLYRRNLLKRLRGDVLRRQERGERFRPDWKRRLRTEFSGGHFYLTADGVTLYYQPRALSDAPSPLLFFLPWDETGGPRRLF